MPEAERTGSCACVAAAAPAVGIVQVERDAGRLRPSAPPHARRLERDRYTEVRPPAIDRPRAVAPTAAGATGDAERCRAARSRLTTAAGCLLGRTVECVERRAPRRRAIDVDPESATSGTIPSGRRFHTRAAVDLGERRRGCVSETRTRTTWPARVAQASVLSPTPRHAGDARASVGWSALAATITCGDVRQLRRRAPTRRSPALRSTCAVGDARTGAPSRSPHALRLKVRSIVGSSTDAVSAARSDR